MFLSRGFAFAASDYSVQGWAVKEAIEDTEALRRYFMAKHGAMPMCGPLGPAIEQLPGALSIFHAVIGELKQRAGGEPFDNRNRIYVGFGDDANFNRSVKRYTATPSARDYVRQNAMPTGRLADPMLTIHTTSDALVLGSDVTTSRRTKLEALSTHW